MLGIHESLESGRNRTLRSLALANQKGGVGKTTTAVHLAHGLALAGQRVALFDLDPQGNATLSVQSMSPDSPTTDEARSPMRALAETCWILPSPGAERNLERDEKIEVGKLIEFVESQSESLDWLIVDCPPRMDQWGWAGLELCEEVLVPVQAEFFAMQGLTHMLGTLEQARRQFPGRSNLLGVVVTMLDLKEPVATEILADLRRSLGSQLLQTIVFRDSQLVEAASHGITLFEYNQCSKGARSYGELVREVMYGQSSIG